LARKIFVLLELRELIASNGGAAARKIGGCGENRLEQATSPSMRHGVPENDAHHNPLGAYLGKYILDTSVRLG
jgi:hypothetical protein